MSPWSHVRVERDGRHAVLTIDRQEKLNALDAELLVELGAAFESLGEEDDVLGIVITGAGEKAFVAGADVAEIADLDPMGAVELSRRGQALFSTVERFPKPVIAAVGGYALGGGCELALACHLRVAAESARLGLPEVGLGLVPGYGGTVRLARLVGLGRALEMILTGRPVSAEKAASMGLVNAVVETEELVPEALALLSAVTSNGPIAVRMALRSVYGSLDVPVERALDAESALFGLLVSTEDMKEGTAAFLERREADFGGR